jgi:hypothetical protein
LVPKPCLVIWRFHYWKPKGLRTPGLCYPCVSPTVKCLVSEILGGNSPSICINEL